MFTFPVRRDPHDRHQNRQKCTRSVPTPRNQRFRRRWHQVVEQAACHDRVIPIQQRRPHESRCQQQIGDFLIGIKTHQRQHTDHCRQRSCQDFHDRVQLTSALPRNQLQRDGSGDHGGADDAECQERSGPTQRGLLAACRAGTRNCFKFAHRDNLYWSETASSFPSTPLVLA